MAPGQGGHRGPLPKAIPFILCVRLRLGGGLLELLLQRASVFLLAEFRERAVAFVILVDNGLAAF